MKAVERASHGIGMVGWSACSSLTSLKLSTGSIPHHGVEPHLGTARRPLEKHREIDQTYRVERVQRVLPVSGAPVELLGTVMDAVEAPQYRNAVLQPVTPIDK